MNEDDIRVALETGLIYPNDVRDSLARREKEEAAMTEQTEPTREAFPVRGLTKAERWAREFSADYPAGHMDVLLAEYERRGRIVEAATALVWLAPAVGGQLVIEGDGGVFANQLDALAKEVHGDE